MNHNRKACLVLGDKKFVAMVGKQLELTQLVPICRSLSSAGAGVDTGLEIKGIVLQLPDCDEEHINSIVSVIRQFPEAKVVVVSGLLSHSAERLLRTQRTVFLGGLELFHQHSAAIINSAFSQNKMQ